MITFTVTLAISFMLVLASGLIVNCCKRRQNKTRHGLTGMCHETGGTMCSSCSSMLLDKRKQSSCRTADQPSSADSRDKSS